MEKPKTPRNDETPLPEPRPQPADGELREEQLDDAAGGIGINRIVVTDGNIKA